MAIDDPFDAFRFDRAIFTFGTFLEGKLQDCEGKSKKEVKSKQLRVFEKYLGRPKAQGASGSSRKFADPAKTRS